MSDKQETTRSITLTPDEAFRGVITLKDIKAQGVRDVIVIVIDKKNRKHVLTTLGPTKKSQIEELTPEAQECEHAPEVPTAQYVMSTSELTIPPGLEEGDKFTNSADGCHWLIKSIQLDGDWTITNVECIGPRPEKDSHVPKCDNRGQIIDVREYNG